MATALQMISWGLEVNDYGNAMLDDGGNFIKVEGRGATEPMWQQMLDYAQSNGLKGGNFKKLNLPFENKLLGQPKEVRDQMANLVEEFVHNLLVKVFNAKDTAGLAVDTILEAGSYDPGPNNQLGFYDTQRHCKCNPHYFGPYVNAQDTTFTFSGLGLHNTTLGDGALFDVSSSKVIVPSPALTSFIGT